MKEYKDSEEIKRQLRIWVQECEDWLEQREADCFRDCIDLIDEIPAADVVEVRHGLWEKAEDDYFGLHIIKCSECREEWCFEVDDDVKDLNYNYCPHCGCKMDKEE